MESITLPIGNFSSHRQKVFNQCAQRSKLYSQCFKPNYIKIQLFLCFLTSRIIQFFFYIIRICPDFIKDIFNKRLMKKQDICKFGLQCKYLSQGRCLRWHPPEHLILCNSKIFLIGRRESDFKHVEFIYQQFDCIEVSPIKSLYQSIINLKVIQDQQIHYYEARRKQGNKIQIKSQLPDREAVKIILSSMPKSIQNSSLLSSRSQFSSRLGTAYRFFFNSQFNFFILGEDGRKIKAQNIQKFCLYDAVRVSYINNPNKKNYITQVHWENFQEKLSGIVQVTGRQFYFIPRNEKKDKIHLLNTHPVMNIIPELRNYNFFKDQKISKQRQREINKQLVDYLFIVKVIGLSPELGYACWFEDPYFKGINCDNLIKSLKYEYEDKIVFKSNLQQLNQGQFAKFKEYYAKELKNRPLVKGFTFSIDSEGAQCYDDAYTIIKQGNLFNVKIHIADVGGLIEQGSNLDNILKKSKESQYIKNNFVPMLNKEIANIFSLSKDQEKNVLTIQFKIDAQARIDFQNVQFYQSKIIANENYSHFNCDLRKEESLKNFFELGKVLQMQSENEGEGEETTHATISRLIQLVKDIPAFFYEINYARLMQKHFSISYLNYPEELFKKLQKLQKKTKFLQEDRIQGKEDTDEQVEDDRLDINSENEDGQISISEDEISYEIKFPILELKKSQLQSKKRIDNLFKEFGIDKDLSKKENFKKGFKEIMKKQDNLTFKLYIKRFMNLNKAHFPFIAKHLETIEKKNEKKKIDKNELRQKIMQKIKFYEKMFFTAYFYFLKNKQEQNKKSQKNAQNIINMMQSYLKSTRNILPLQSEMSHLQIDKMVFGDKNQIQNQFKKFLKTNSKSKLFKWNNPIRSYSAIITQRIIYQNKQNFNHLLSWDEVLAKEELNKWRSLRSLINKNLSLIQKQVTKQERILYREINNEVDKINLFEKTRLEGIKEINFIRIPQQQHGQGKFWAYHQIFDVQAFDVSPKLFKELDKIPYYHEFPLLIEINLFKFPDPFNLMVKQT